MEAIERACDAVGGTNALAKAIGVSAQAVSQWRANAGRVRRRVPPARCIAIERATGGAVTRYELRPDVFVEQEAA